MPAKKKNGGKASMPSIRSINRKLDVIILDRGGEEVRLAERMEQLEKAVIQLNHFSETIEKLDLAQWKGQVTVRLDLLTWFMGLTAAGVISGVVKLVFFNGT